MNDGVTENEARLKANQKLNGVDLDQFISRYFTLIQYIIQWKNGKLHSNVLKVVDDLLEDGMDYTKAVKVAIRKNKHMLEIYLDEVIDNDNYDEYDDASDDDDDDDDDEGEEVGRGRRERWRRETR